MMCSSSTSMQLQVYQYPNYLHNLNMNNYSSPLRRRASSTTPRLPPHCSLQTGRRSGGYGLALWDFDSIQSLNTTHYKEERNLITRAQALIVEVRKMLMQGEGVVDDVGWLELIDDLHRLGVSCHFENQIIRFLISTYSDHKQRDLYSTSLRFRLLRQHGFSVSQEVFDCFKNEKGTDFKPSLEEDIKGLLQLYEASFLQTQGEDTLEVARKFSTRILQREVDDDQIHDDNLLSSIRAALEFPSHWRVQMPNARSSIDAYERRPDMNPIVLQLAKLDMNIVQAQFQQELKEASRWWESTGLAQQLPFVRDRIVECYFWTSGVIERREHGYERIMLTKINALVTTIDDVFDIYGTLQELQLFTTTIQRWDDVESIEKLPPYMQLCYLAVHNFVNEMAYDTLKEKGFNSIPYLRKTWVDLVEAYLKEAEWYDNGHKPSMEEYINNAWISIGGVPILSHIYFRLTDSIQREGADEMHKYHDLVRASSTIVRLADDLGTSLEEVERGDVPKSIECCMNEKNCREEEAREHVRWAIEETWKTMNTEMNSPLFSKHYIEAAANLARMAQFIYQDGSDGFGMQHSTVNKLLAALLFQRHAWEDHPNE